MQVDVVDDSSSQELNNGLDIFLNSKSTRQPPAHKLELTHTLISSPRHEPLSDFIEPKVFSPHKTRRGLVPRPIEVERKKRAFINHDIVEHLSTNGLLDHIKTISNPNNQQYAHTSIETMSLSFFDDDDYESHSLESWIEIIESSKDIGLPARAMRRKSDGKDGVYLVWDKCMIVSGNIRRNKFQVKFIDEIKTENTEPLFLERLYICFDAEDPITYCDRLNAVLLNKRRIESTMSLNFYVDCMPVDNLKPLLSEQVSRILLIAVNNDKLRNNTQLDTSTILQHYNLNHMRTLNQLIFINMMTKKQKETNMVNPNSNDMTLFVNPDLIFRPIFDTPIPTDVTFDEKIKLFKFNSLWNNLESIKIIYQIQVENVNLEKPEFFFTPEKSVRVDDFNLSQISQGNILFQLVKETWVNAVTQSVRYQLKDVKKGWFNIEESNLEVYNFSKLRKFMFRVNFMMEDIIRDLMYRSVTNYYDVMLSFCPKSVKIKSSSKIDIVGGSFPIFTVDLKFVNGTPTEPPQFIYTTTTKSIMNAVLSPFDNIFEALKGITKVERRVMKKLFWAYEPVMRIPHIGEDWVVNMRTILVERIENALKPMEEYLDTLGDFMELISTDPETLALEMEEKHCPVDGVMNLSEIINAARQHSIDAEAIFYQLPSSVSLGIILIDLKSVKTLLAQKHKIIAAALFSVVEKKTKQFADEIVKEFREIFDGLSNTPTTIETVTDMKDYIQTLPPLVEELSERISKNDAHFALMEDAKWQLPLDQMDLRWEVFRWPLYINIEITKQEKQMRVLEHQFKRDMDEEQQDFNQDIANIKIDISKLKDCTELSAAEKNAENVRRIRVSLQQADEKSRLFNSRESLFNAQITEYSEINELSKYFEPFFDLWDCAEKWLKNKESWTNGSFMVLDSDAVEFSVNTLLRNLAKSARTFERINLSQCNVIAAQVRDEVDQFKPKVPLIVCLRNAGMRDRHWDDLCTKTGAQIPEIKDTMSLQDLCDMNLVEKMDAVEKVSERASKEYMIETSLDKMTKQWESVILIVEEYRETGTCVLKGVDEYMNLLDEHITMTQAMSFSAFKGPFEPRIDSWNNSLQVVSEVVDEWVTLQRNWLYLEPIFSSADINKQLPQEGKRFATVDKYWRQTMSSAVKGVQAVRFCDDPRLLERFKEGNKLLEMVQKGLADYLETKRAGFSRFYFLSNDELLEILSETKDPLRVQPHLRKCFEGIKSVKFEDDLTITGMTSPENEKVPFVKPVDPKNKNIEAWMVELCNGMLSAIRDNILHSILDYTETVRTKWMQVWAAQCVLNGSQLHWTREVEASLNEKGNVGAWDYYNQLVRQLEDMVILIRGEISKAARVTVGSLAVVDVHARDVQKKMAENGIDNVNDFDWFSQMRYYWHNGDIDEKKGDLAVIMVSSKRMYGYEYLGNTFRLVITPLTDKCYLTLMGALQMILGGAPAGPAGTGKTETTKDLAKALAKQCVVFNCSDGLDYMAMGKFFKGLASAGAWACFDEFNRINIEVLSVIAQQVIQLQGTVQRGEKRTVFEGTDINVNPEFAVFITMNPGYAGRAELPDNLEALFRPVAMMVPDYGLIGEIMMFSYGYMENRKCAAKMVATFKLCSEQLSSQDHYDYGMRAVKTVITAAGNLKRASPNENEEALLMRALLDVNTPKFLAQDLPLFAGILGDLFPGIIRPGFDYGPLIGAIKESIYDRNLQAVDMFITKIIELYEMICVRHGLMVVGPTGGGKSNCIRCLGSALTKLAVANIEGLRYEKTKILHINPKAIKMGQLYGEFDENTHEWQDGILCVLIRECIKDDNSNLKWMLFDGPVDALWIENMNTVLDDNKKLCLVSGEIIQLSDPMTMMFEPEDLAVASPATVSRCGMIYMEPTSLGYDVLLQSWLETIPPCFGEEIKTVISRLFDHFVPSILPFLRRNLVEPLPSVNNALVQSFFNLMDTYFAEYIEVDDGRDKKTPEEVNYFMSKIESIFIFCIIWSMTATVDAIGRKIFNNFFRIEMINCKIANPPPSEHSIYDYKYMVEDDTWIEWTTSAPPYVYDSKLSFSEFIIPTADSICYTFLLDILVRNGKHVLMTGGTGTGKTVNISAHLQSGLPDRYIPIPISFSAQTSANQTQDLIDSKTEKRRKGVYGPAAGKEFIIFVDDVNMPQKEEYGSQPPIEILRQWFDNSGWFDRTALEMRKIIDVVFVCACGPPGGGRNEVSARFYRHFNIINYVDMSDKSLYLIFGTILKNFLSLFDPSIQEHSLGVVKASVAIYNSIIDELRPTPAKAHYTFNMRDVSKIFQGMLMSDKRKVQSADQFGRLWYHEFQRVFGDRLINNEDKDWLNDKLKTNLESFTTLKVDDLFSEKKDIVFTDFMIPGADPRIYDDIDTGELQSTIEDYLGEYNAESKQPMNLVMFNDAIMHVCKIVRVLRQPSGHALLLGVGGSGRQSLTRLASSISGFRVYQIEIAKGYGMNEWRENLKECLLVAGVSNKPIVFLFNDTQIINENMLEDVNGILNSGDVPNLYAPEDIEAITSACKPLCARKKIPPTKINIFSQFLFRVKENIHVVLCMSPLGDAFRTRLRKFPSLSTCCTIDWFMEWPDEALQSVAGRFIASSNLGLDSSTEKKLMGYFQFIHQSVERAAIEYKDKLRRRFYVTPTSYLELLSTYYKTLIDKRKEVGTLRDRLAIGVDKLLSTEKAVNELQTALTEMEPVLIKTQAEVEVMIIQITKDKGEAAVTKAAVEIEEASAIKKAAETKAIADDAQRDLDEALPALAEAVQCLKDLKKSDIDEVKSLGKPPINVVRTLQACCIMFDIKPDMVNDPDNPGKKLQDFFKPAQKHLLSNANKLLDDMANYDKDNIQAHIITKFEPFYNDPTFLPEIIEKSSKACKAMCMWSRAMYKYYQVTLVVEPKKLQLAEAQASLDITMGILKDAQQTLANAEAKISELEASFKEANDKKEQLVFDVDQCSQRLDRAVKLMGGLGGEKTRWIATCSDLNEEYDNLVGNSLISAGAIAYLGVFTPDFRFNIIQSWQDKLAEVGILHSKGTTLRNTLADPIAIRQWTICGLPEDSQSVENGIMMAKGRRYPLLIDPQGQANRFIKNMGKEPNLCPNDIDIIKLSDKNFLRTLENGVRFGRWVLLENIGETLDAALEPLLLQQKFKQGGTEMIKIGDSVIPWNDSFKFFITTKLPNPHYAPEVCVKVSLINFAITFTGLEDQLLGVIVIEEMPEMEEKKNSLVVSNSRMRKELKELEDLILFMLSNSQGNILDDHKLIETLATSKVKSAEISLKVQEAEKTEKIIDENRNMYRPVAFRGSVLYFCTVDLGGIDPMYQYSLQWYRNLFIQGIRLSATSDDINVRLQNLNEFFTYYVYVNICRSLFERHKLLFAFLLTINILKGDNKIDPIEWSFLISGKTIATDTKENPAPDWLDGRMWGEICSMSTLESFKGLNVDVINNIDDWRELYDDLEPHNTALPGLWPDKLNSLQKLCVLRAIRADKIPDGIMNYVIEQTGQKYVEPPPFDMLSCFKDSNVLSPLIFVLSKGSDPAKAWVEFSVKMKMDRKTKMLSLGQGQGPKAVKMIEEGTQKGFWVLLQNCHLYISWLQELERICEGLSPDSVHKDFRLWLTSMPSDKFPVSVLQSSVKMTNEPPKGLRSNLRNAYFKLNNDMLNLTKKPAEYKKILFGLSFFHACVQERRMFGPLGWNIPYEFNDTDLDISRGQLELFLDAYEETPWQVLRFLTSYINYGGRVTDYIDLRTMDVIIRSFYNPKLLDKGYKFDKEGIFYSLDFDENDPHASYISYIESLPMVASPSVFGMHENAKIASANAETFSMFEICMNLSAGDGGGGGGVGAKEKLIGIVAADVNTKISSKGVYDIEGIGMLYPVLYEESMNTVLVQECIRYNKLIEAMIITLPVLIKALKGLVVMSKDLEDIGNAIALNIVPNYYSNVGYPSMKPFGAWVVDLMDRLSMINEWIDKGVPAVFWISGFYFPQAFLTGSLQNYARKHKFPIDIVNFNYELLEEEWNTLLERPEDGVYIRGLYMEGARWDPDICSINDSLPKQLFTEIPCIHLCPEQNRKDPTKGIYRCPVYKVLSRRGTLSTTGHSTNFIMWIEIPSNRANTTNNIGLADQEEWIRAGVAAFCSLMY
jgi:dynein heavy chain